ncbi:hypothetical protein IGI04_001848 [Brassica rapa subsp. trilocularis]|uniref:F-box domain-containing protein n=1 Tax=Brassica rapa subsp. trilocularis TaxID=1813537 RepID=A0ABQ7NUP0_BRACM|nr:hypothetical protein IGI04_001848 [Brassica rapa subsp. trilocularis]
MKMKMSDLPRELAEEVLCRIPVTSLRPVRSTCKKWNKLSRCGVFAKKHLAHHAKVAERAMEDPLVVIMDYRPEAKLIGPDGSDQIDVREIFHCHGLLLCIPKDHSRLVVLEPLLGANQNLEFSSDSWRILDLLPRDWMIGYGERGLTFKGNTYWFASEIQFKNSFLVCFDFTRKTFWSHLPLPFEDTYPEDTVSLSSVREDQLVVLFQPWDILTLEIWISNKIDEHNAMSWNNKVFLSADIRQLIHPQWQFPVSASFFIDEEMKIAVFFDKDADIQNPTREVAYIIGVDGSFKAADVRECADKVLTAFVCSYVPSLVQLN